MISLIFLNAIAMFIVFLIPILVYKIIFDILEDVDGGLYLFISIIVLIIALFFENMVIDVYINLPKIFINY